MKLHFLDPRASEAVRLSPEKVAAKLKAGWSWHRLSPSFCAAGGAATYSRVLVSPGNEIAYVSDRAAGPSTPPELDTLPVLEICHRLIPLQVPFAEKAAAKALGAIWIAHKRTWACAPDNAQYFAQWHASGLDEFDLMTDESTDPGDLGGSAARPDLRPRSN